VRRLVARALRPRQAGSTPAGLVRAGVVTTNRILHASGSIGVASSYGGRTRGAGRLGPRVRGLGPGRGGGLGVLQLREAASVGVGCNQAAGLGQGGAVVEEPGAGEGDVGEVQPHAAAVMTTRSGARPAATSPAMNRAKNRGTGTSTLPPITT